MVVTCQKGIRYLYCRNCKTELKGSQVTYCSKKCAKEQFNKDMMTYYRRDKSKWNARGKAHYRIKISSDAKCQLCNSTKKLQRHHQDYNKPLEVIILCEECHKNHHKQERQKLHDEKMLQKNS